MNKKSLILGLAMLLSVSAMADTKVIAHRGYWNTPGSAKNSINSLENANKIGVYGSETDVWITKDNVVFVNHDPVFKGVRLETSTADEVKKLTLDNGENMPTLQEYLKVAKKETPKLIIEVKTHKDINRQNACIDKTLQLVKKAKMQKNVIYIAFSYKAVLYLIKKAPKGTEVYYLNGDKSPEELKAIGCAGPDYEQKVFMVKHPEWFDECHRLGMKINVWTVDKQEDLKYFVDKKADFITTNEPVLLQSIIAGK